MQYREVGDTGVKISEIGFGCGGTAGLMVRGSPEEQRNAAARAIELGINYFDNAPDYGDRVAETNLGRVIRELGVRPYITTKVEVRNDNLDDIAGHVVRSVDESLKCLGTDYVDFLQIHNGPVTDKPDLQGRAYNILWLEDYLRPGGALEGLERVKRQGKVRFIGFIVRGNDAGPVQQLLDTGVFSLANVSYHLLNPTAGQPKPRGLEVDTDWGQFIPRAQAAGVGIAIYSPLANGFLNDNIAGGGAPHPLAGGRNREGREYQDNVARAHAMQQILSRLGQSLAQAAYRYLLANPAVTTVLGGFSDLSHINELTAASGPGPLTEEEMARVEMAWRGNFGLS
jgi:aryl-alcohol dehydrogenase-like predicted oxidoreductase